MHTFYFEVWRLYADTILFEGLTKDLNNLSVWSFSRMLLFLSGLMRSVKFHIMIYEYYYNFDFVWLIYVPLSLGAVACDDLMGKRNLGIKNNSLRACSWVGEISNGYWPELKNNRISIWFIESIKLLPQLDDII